MAHKYRGKYRVRWMDENSKYRSKSFPSGTPKEVVDKWEMQRKLKVIFPTKKEEFTFKQLAEFWLRDYARTHKTPSSIAKDVGIFKHHLFPSFENKSVSEITNRDILNLQSSLFEGKKRYASQSINNIISLASSVFRHGITLGIVTNSPCSGIRRIKRLHRTPTFWTFDETSRYLAYCRIHDWELFQLCAFAVTTGLRPGELQGLLRDCLDFDTGYVTVRRNWCTKTNVLNEYTKGKRNRRISVPKDVLMLLADKRGLGSEEFVFPFVFNSLGHRRIRPMAIAADVKPIRFHDLRHTFASHLIMKGRHVVEVMELLGHTKLETTMRYLHLAEERTKGITDCLTEGMSWIRDSHAKIIQFSS